MVHPNRRDARPAGDMIGIGNKDGRGPEEAQAAGSQQQHWTARTRMHVAC